MLGVMPTDFLDALDPPAWGPAPSGATFLIRRCHELRRKSLDEYTVEDLRLMIGQQIGLPHLLPIALQRLGANPLAEGDFYPGDLLANVLRIDAEFWLRQPVLAQLLGAVLEDLRRQPPANIEPTLGALIARFNDEHPASHGLSG
jgi:contact-dependent growth inhibition (CDI) system CdiI-like immunity protein